MTQRAPCSPFPYLPPWTFPTHHANWGRFPVPQNPVFMPNYSPVMPNYPMPMMNNNPSYGSRSEKPKLVDSATQTDGCCGKKPVQKTAETQTFMADLIEAKARLTSLGIPLPRQIIDAEKFFQSGTPEHRMYRNVLRISVGELDDYESLKRNPVVKDLTINAIIVGMAPHFKHDDALLRARIHEDITDWLKYKRHYDKQKKGRKPEADESAIRVKRCKKTTNLTESISHDPEPSQPATSHTCAEAPCHGPTENLRSIESGPAKALTPVGVTDTNLSKRKSQSDNSCVARGLDSVAPRKPSDFPKDKAHSYSCKDPYDYNDHDDNLNLVELSKSYTNDLKVKFSIGDVAVLGRTSKKYDFVKILDIMEVSKKLTVIYLERKRDRTLAPYEHTYREPFDIRFNHLIYKLSSTTYFSAEEEGIVKDTLRETFAH